MIAENIPLECDHCQEPIVGPLIRCINCVYYNLCFRCSTTVDFGRDPQLHNNSHICTVIFDSSM